MDSIFTNPSYDDDLHLFDEDDLLKDLCLERRESYAAVCHQKTRKMSVRDIKINRALVGHVNSQRDRKAYIRNLWLKAYQLVLHEGVDPWKTIDFSSLSVERVKRYRYNALKRRWVEDLVEVRMEAKPFGHGAMRECFRMKKMSTMCVSKDWHLADNYVAKRYLDSVDRKVYFDDVKLQMDAKLWGEEYNKQAAVARKVDIIQMSIIEFFNQPGSPLYHVEHFIEGSYRKYNSNSGFVDHHARNTPHAFSHFSFEWSGHQILIVDIQGVGDLWTDPQIHTVQAGVYGDGNLGIRGMALFFHTHKCNQICSALGLAPFDLHPSELEQLASPSGNKTSSPEMLVSEPFFGATMAVPLELRKVRAKCEMDCRPSNLSPCARLRLKSGDDEAAPEEAIEGAKPIERKTGAVRRKHLQSECWPDSPVDNNQNFMNLNEQQAGSTDSNLFTNVVRKERAMLEFGRKILANHKSSSIDASIASGAVYLGEIHHELARLHESGRFTRLEQAIRSNDDTQAVKDHDLDKFKSDGPDAPINWEAVLFHEESAAQLGCLDAQISMAHYFLGLMVDGPMADCPIKSPEDPKQAFCRGYQMMIQAANSGDRSCILYLAETNLLGSPENELKPDWSVARFWFQKAIDLSIDRKQSDCEEEDKQSDHGISVSFNSVDEWPLHRLYSQMAELLASGGNSLKRDPAKAYEFYEMAADAANEALDGSKAMKYYAKMEQLDLELGEAEQ